jgi:signal transduction histidine kinase
MAPERRPAILAVDDEPAVLAAVSRDLRRRFSNAIDAVGDSVTITIVTRRDGSWVEVDVSDDGPGVPPDARDRIFDVFFTGSLNLDSEPGRTTFRVRLPITPAS